MEQQQKQQDEHASAFKLQKPFTFEGKTYTEFPFDLEALTGEDLISCERLMNTITNEFVLAKSISMVFQLTIASRAAKVPPEVLQALPAKEFSRMMQRVQNFLLY